MQFHLLFDSPKWIQALVYGVRANLSDHMRAQHPIAFKLRFAEPLVHDCILGKSFVAFVKIQHVRRFAAVQ